MKSFLSDRTRVESPGVAVGGSSGFATAGVQPHAKGHGQSGEHSTHVPQIECVRQGDRITRLVVVCACGERIEIDCLYAQGQ